MPPNVRDSAAAGALDVRTPARKRQRQLFDVARAGDVRSFKFLLRRSRSTMALINFQYSARVAEEGGSNLWPWYWCIDNRDILNHCWGAPSGIQPENGDTLLIIALKIGMEEHVQCLLRNRALDLGVRNSSGLDAAGVAARCGRESLISRQQACYEMEHLRTKASSTSRQRRRPRGRMRTGVDRASKRGCTQRDDSSYTSVRPLVDSIPAKGTTIEGVLHGNQNKGGLEGIEVIEGSSQTASEGASGANARARVLPFVTKGDNANAHIRADDSASPHPDSDEGGNVLAGNASSSLVELGEVHPVPGATRAVAVQTDPASLHAARPAEKSAQQETSRKTAGLLSQPLCKYNTHDAPLRRRSTAPGNLFSGSLEEAIRMTSLTRPDEVGRGEQQTAGVDPWKSDSAASTASDTDTASNDSAPASALVEGTLAGRNSGTAILAEPLAIDPTVSRAASVDEPAPESSGTTLDAMGGTAVPEGDFVVRPQEVPHPKSESAGRSFGSGNVGGPPGAVRPGQQARSKVDEVTHELQKLLREDALQEDGSLDYSEAFELFDADQDGNVTPSELHAIFIRLGMGNLLSQEGISTIVRRVPRDASGLITQKGLEIFADRPADFPWELRRDNSGNGAGNAGSRGVDRSMSISAALHELQVEINPHAGGMLSWKKASRKLSSIPLFVRITRGHHVRDSAPVLPCLHHAGGGDDGGEKKSGDKDDGMAVWSWRWEETLVLPGTMVPEPSGGEEGKGGGGSEGQNGDDYVAVANIKQENCASSYGKDRRDATETPSPIDVHSAAGRAISGGAAVEHIPDAEGSSSGVISTSVHPACDDSGGFGESYRKGATAVVDTQVIEATLRENVDAPVAEGSIKKKGRVAFWSPRRKGKNTGANTDATAPQTTSGNVLSTTTDLTIGVVNVTAVGEESLSDSDASDSGSKPEANAKELGGMTSSCTEHFDENSPGRPGKMNDVPAESLSEGGTKRTVSFWSPGKRRKKHTERDPARAPESGGLGSKCDSEAPTVFDLSDPEEDEEELQMGKAKHLEPAGEPGTKKASPGGLQKNSGGSAWRPKVKSTWRTKKSGPHGDKQDDLDDAGSLARGDHRTSATTKPRHLTAGIMTVGKSILSDTRVRRRRPEPSRLAAAPQDVLLIEVWEIRSSTPLMPSWMPDAPESNAVDKGVRSASSSALEKVTKFDPLPVMEEASVRSYSGDESLSTQASEPTHALIEAPTHLQPEHGERHDEGLRLRSVRKERRSSVDHIYEDVLGGRTLELDDEASVTSTISTKTTRRRRPALFASPFASFRIKREDKLKVPASGPRQTTSSATETSKDSQEIENADDVTPPVSAEKGKGPQEAQIPGEDGAGGHRGLHTPKETGTVTGDDNDDPASAGKHLQTSMSGKLLSALKGKKAIKNSLSSIGGKCPANPKPVLWGQLTIPVTCALRSGTSDKAGNTHDESLVNRPVEHLVKKRKECVVEDESNTLRPGPNTAPNTAATDSSSVRSPKDGGDRAGSRSAASRIQSVKCRGPTNQAGEKKGGAFGGKSTNVPEKMLKTRPRPSTATASTDEGWFEVGCPKGQAQGKRVKGRVHMEFVWGET